MDRHAITNNLTRAAVNFIDTKKELGELAPEDLTDEVIEDSIEKAIDFLGFVYTENDKETCRNTLKYMYQIKSTPGNKILNNYEQEEWYTKIKADLKQTTWDRYRSYLIEKKGFSPNVVSVLEKDTLDRDLMNSLLDPNIETDTPILRRGLVIGDIQSGKTSTYIGLICKAADAGYKVFILLTGITESLRKQTQERVEEGFIGIDMSGAEGNGRRVGVGLTDPKTYASAFTSRTNDFTGNTKKIAIALEATNAVVFVIKKQKNVLETLTKWLVSLNADPVTDKIDLPMLMIDDEADNASINTSKSGEDPTTINRLIRNLANVFTRSTYVGFTATPFANVFINPEKTEDMENQDLFPEDFIVTLPTPSNYIGPQQIFDENGEYHSQLIYITDAGVEESDGHSFYFKHQKEWQGELPESLTDAVYAFYIVNAIRDLRGDVKTHRSMLINISRFVKVQQHTCLEVEEIHKKAYREIKFNLSHDYNESMKSPVLRRIHSLWEELFSDTEFKWDDIVDTLYKSIESIQIKVINSNKKSEKLIYPANESVRVIAIGGLALSRGLTLEGLVISYFYRNTCTYDVLMQMGRWFGYRRGYEDLFRIWIYKASAEWYAEISKATEELKADMSLMNELKLHPRDFGIRVKNDAEDLQITAPNKMRNSKDEALVYSYFGNIIETPYLVYNPEKQKANFNTVIKFLNDLVDKDFSLDLWQAPSGKERYIIKDVPKTQIAEFIRNLEISRYNNHFDSTQVFNFIMNCNETCLDLFDITLIEGTKSKIRVEIAGAEINAVQRGSCTVSVEGDRLNIGRRGKLGGPTDGLAGIVSANGKSADEIIETAKTRYRKEYNRKQDEDFTYPGKTWFQYVPDRKPLLIIYFIDVEGQENQKEAFNTMKKEMNGLPSVGFAVGFPENENAPVTEFTQYRANKAYNWFEMNEILAESEEE